MKMLTRSLRFVAVIALATFLPCISLAASEGSQKPRIPAVIHECESGEGTYICLDWHWNGSAYEKTGPDGLTEIVTLRFDKTPAHAVAGQGVPVTFIREVKTGVADGLGVTYKAVLSDGKIENGTVKWTYKGIEKSGTWTGTYAYSGNGEQKQ